MTGQPEFSPDEPLPGLADPASSPTAYGASELQTQVRRSLRYLADQGLVDERHAGLMQLALELARAVRPGERAYGIAQAAAQLLATFDKLMPEQEGAGGGEFNELQAYLRGVGDAGGITQVRDPS